jgi:hypothetical protein
VINPQVVWDYALATSSHFLPRPHQATTEPRFRSTPERVKHEHLKILGQRWSHAIHTGKRTTDPPSLPKEKL